MNKKEQGSLRRGQLGERAEHGEVWWQKGVVILVLCRHNWATGLSTFLGWSFRPSDGENLTFTRARLESWWSYPVWTGSAWTWCSWLQVLRKHLGKTCHLKGMRVLKTTLITQVKWIWLIITHSFIAISQNNLAVSYKVKHKIVIWPAIPHTDFSMIVHRVLFWIIKLYNNPIIYKKVDG